MIDKLVSLAAIALSMSSGAIETVRETRITATWTCSAPHALATDATATVRECRWIVR